LQHVVNESLNELDVSDKSPKLSKILGWWHLGNGFDFGWIDIDASVTYLQ